MTYKRIFWRNMIIAILGAIILSLVITFFEYNYIVKTQKEFYENMKNNGSTDRFITNQYNLYIDGTDSSFNKSMERMLGRPLTQEDKEKEFSIFCMNYMNYTNYNNQYLDNFGMKIEYELYNEDLTDRPYKLERDCLVNVMIEDAEDSTDGTRAKLFYVCDDKSIMNQLSNAMAQAKDRSNNIQIIVEGYYIKDDFSFIPAKVTAVISDSSYVETNRIEINTGVTSQAEMEAQGYKYVNEYNTVSFDTLLEVGINYRFTKDIGTENTLDLIARNFRDGKADLCERDRSLKEKIYLEYAYICTINLPDGTVLKRVNYYKTNILLYMLSYRFMGGFMFIQLIIIQLVVILIIAIITSIIVSRIMKKRNYL